MLVAGLIWSVGLLLGARWEFWIETPAYLSALPMQRSIIDTGMRLPLGIASDLVLGGVWCVVTRTPWRQAGDGFALQAALIIAFGRAGCLLVGCCTGRVCPTWLDPICLRYGSGSEAFVAQLQSGQISPTTVGSLPVHPLALYFALAAAGLTLVCSRLVARRAEAGSLLLVSLLWWQTSKLLLEQPRAVPRPPQVMLGIPAVLLLLGLVLAATAWQGRTTRAGIMSTPAISGGPG
jgi:prolipoprotein diacylglyceryltransferase